MALPQPRYAGGEQQRAFYAALDERLAAAPGVQSAALATSAPFNSRDSRGIVMDNESLADRNPACRDARSWRSAIATSRHSGCRSGERPPLRGPRCRRPRHRRARQRTVRPALLSRCRSDRPRSPAASTSARRTRQPARVTIVGIAPPLRQQIAAGHTPVVYVPFDDAAGGDRVVADRARQPGAVRDGRPQRSAAARSRLAGIQPAVARTRLLYVALDPAHHGLRLQHRRDHRDRCCRRLASTR